MVSDVSPGVQWLDPWIQGQLQEAGEVWGCVAWAGGAGAEERWAGGWAAGDFVPAVVFFL